MDPVYIRIRERARQIVSDFPAPDFYKVFSDPYNISMQCFDTDPVIVRLRAFVSGYIDNDFGHGMKHAGTVAIDAGTLILVEGEAVGYPENILLRLLTIVQCAGLLHDIKRKHKNHAEVGAAFAEKTLKSFPLSRNEIKMIHYAINSHEAFTDNIKPDSPESSLLSSCLYDADKFRWGPDNFSDTVWDMLSFFNIPLSKFIDNYAKGMDGIAQIKHTFRTGTGEKYGPQFIDIGLAVGNKLFEVISTEFNDMI